MKLGVTVDRFARRPQSLSMPFYGLPEMYDPATAKPTVETTKLEREALRVFYAVAPRSGGIVKREFRYFEPDFRDAGRQEMTPAHYEMVEQKRPTVFYCWEIWFRESADGVKWSYQTIYVDARTGRATGWDLSTFAAPGLLLGSSDASAPSSPALTGTWKLTPTLGGDVVKTDATFVGRGFPVFLTDPKGTLRSVAYDPKAGLIKVDEQVLKVDPILRKALPTKAPVRSVFGKTSLPAKP